MPCRTQGVVVKADPPTSVEAITDLTASEAARLAEFLTP